MIIYLDARKMIVIIRSEKYLSGTTPPLSHVQTKRHQSIQVSRPGEATGVNCDMLDHSSLYRISIFERSFKTSRVRASQIQ